MIFLLQSFTHLSAEHQWGQLSSNHYVSWYSFSQLVPYFFVCPFCMFVFVPLALISGDIWKFLPVFWTLLRKIGLPIKYTFWLKVSFIYFKSFLLSLDIINTYTYVITKKTLWRYWHILCQKIAMFALVMESASWFAWPRNVIASVQVLITGMIDLLMSLAVNSLLFCYFSALLNHL